MAMSMTIIAGSRSEIATHTPKTRDAVMCVYASLLSSSLKSLLSLGTSREVCFPSTGSACERVSGSLFAVTVQLFA